MSKKLLPLLIMVFLIVSTFPAVAHERVIIPSGEACPKCDGTKTYAFQKREYTSWYKIGDSICNIAGGEFDEVQTRLKIDTYKCTSCGYSDEVSEYEYRTYCPHI